MLKRSNCLGCKGEEAVAEFLIKKGFCIVAKNYKSFYGEIDLIAQKGETLAFVEVKTRSKNYFPTALVVNRSKQNKIIKTAKYFLLRSGLDDKACRFDVAVVLLKNGAYQIDYIENAFY